MKKIMFNDAYGLTKAVLEGRKTMTRRIISAQIHERAFAYRHEYYADTLDAISEEEALLEFSPFKPGEVVAVAQSYGEIGLAAHIYEPGWNNKMFVRAELMPHQIRITNVRVERLQDISDEDCFKEGIYEKTLCPPGDIDYFYHSEPTSKWEVYPSAREAFAALIDKVSGKGTFDSNPWVFVYEFELVK